MSSRLTFEGECLAGESYQLNIVGEGCAVGQADKVAGETDSLGFCGENTTLVFVSFQDFAAEDNHCFDSFHCYILSRF